jgi:DNA-binding Lrp family transcriptional regulator
MISDKEKIIYAIILYLSKENNYCYCTNKTISELLNISVTQVSNLISSLKTKKYIDTKMIYKENTKQVEMRKLIPIQNDDTYLRKVKYPPQENFKDNKYNNKINNKNNGDNKILKKNMANFEQRDYSDFNWNSLYANADISV